MNAGRRVQVRRVVSAVMSVVSFVVFAVIGIGIVTDRLEIHTLAILFAVLALNILLGGFRWDGGRVRATKEWAARVGWTYVGTEPSLPRRWRLRPFGAGSSWRADEVVVGPWRGRQCVSFRYRYTTSSDQGSTTHTYHVVAMALPTRLPTLELTPETVGSRVVTTLGGQDIEVESADFNRVWRVESPDERFAHAVVHPRFMERMLRPDAQGLSLRIEGADVLCWSSGAPDPETLPRRLGVMAALADAVPRFVWLDHGHDPATT